MEAAETREVTRTRRSEGAKLRIRRSERAHRVNLNLTAKELKMLGAHAVGTGKSWSEIVGDLIRANCTRYVLVDRGDGTREVVSASSTGQVSNSDETLPISEGLTGPSPSEEDPAAGAGEGAPDSPALRRRRAAAR